MPAPRCRPFTVLDGMILVAAMAVGFWLLGLHFRGDGRDWRDTAGLLTRGGNYRDVRNGLSCLFWDARFVMLPLTFSIVAVRLRRPRPSVRRLCRQPGFAACASMLAVASISLLGCLSSMAERVTWGDGHGFHLGPVLNYFLTYQFLDYDNTRLGASAASVWAVLTLGRMCRPEPGWIDRSGRWLGAFWLLDLILSVSNIQPD